MLKDPSAKYRPFPPVNLPDRQWPSRTLTRTPLWCSVDLRDGNQALAVPMNVGQKLELFQVLVKCGFKEIEVGFPSASNTEFTFNRRLIEEHRVPDDVWLQVLVQAREELIERTFESLVGAKKVIIHLYNSTSPAQRRVVFGMSKEEILRVAVRCLGFGNIFFRICRDEDHADEIDPLDLPLYRRERSDDEIILVLPHGVLAFRLEGSDNLEGELRDTKHLAHGFHTGEEVVDNCLTDDAHFCRSPDILVGEVRPVLQFPIPDLEELHISALDRRAPVQAACDNLTTCTRCRAHGLNGGTSIPDGINIFILQCDGHSGAGTHATLGCRPGNNHEDVGTKACDLRLNRRLGSLADCDHGDDGSDADDDSQHRQDRTGFLPKK